MNTSGDLVVTGRSSTLTLRNDAPGDNAAFLVVGQRGDGTMRVSDGAKVLIDGGRSLFPGFWVGRGEDDGSAAATGILIVESGGSITVRGDNLSEDGASGFFGVGGRPGATGEMRLEAGGKVTLEGANAIGVIASRDGADGAVHVSGRGSVLDSGVDLFVGRDAVSAPTPALLRIAEGGRVIADRITIADSGALDLGATAEGDVAVSGGALEIGDGAVAAGLVLGDLSFEDGATLGVDLQSFAPGGADRLRVTGDADFNLDAIVVEGALLPGLAFARGDGLDIAEIGGALRAQSRDIDIDGAAFRLIAGAGALRLEALEDRGVAFAETVSAAPSGGRVVLAAEGARFVGGDGGDVAIARGGANRLEGGAGGDRLIGRAGEDTLLGGDGDDTLKPGADDDRVDGGGGNDRILAGDGDDTILAGAGDDVILPGRGNDVIDGGAGNDIARGFRGDERISGGAGDDTLLGGLEDDTLIGGSGNDRLAGGPGRDTFLFDARGFGEDRIVDFRLGSDVIDFRGSGLQRDDLEIAVRGGNTVISVVGASDEIVVGGVNLDGVEFGVYLF